jgi:hypothetical protein
MKIDGACHCGSIRFEAEVDPADVVACHCTDCQTLSGAAFRAVVPTMPGTFVLLSGTPKVYVKTAESGNQRQQTFCPDCGSPIYSAPADGGTRVVVLRAGTIRQRASSSRAINTGSARHSSGLRRCLPSRGRRSSRCSTRRERRATDDRPIVSLVRDIGVNRRTPSERAARLPRAPPRDMHF